MSQITPDHRRVITSQANHVVEAGKKIKQLIAQASQLTGDRSKPILLDVSFDAELEKLEASIQLIRAARHGETGRRVNGRPVDSQPKVNKSIAATSHR